jgi:pyrroline-5-carboxylate reductase
MAKNRIGMIGAGQMATALAQGFLKVGRVVVEDLRAADPLPAARARFTSTTGAQATADNIEVARWADVLFLAVKPGQCKEVLAQLAGAVEGKLVVSVAAGVRLETLAAALGPAFRLIRVMPNAPCMVGQGACGYSLGPGATAEDGQLVRQLLEAVGVAVEVEEHLLDAVTGLSGSGPAFVAVVIEALCDGGVRMGLPRGVATALALQTVRGTAEMLRHSGEHPAVLKDRVASPGGTTMAGLMALETAGVRAGLMAAVAAATRRASELTTS